MRTKTVFVKPNEPGPRVEEVWKDTPRFCPNCGAQHVWRGPGHKFLCLTCSHGFYLSDEIEDKSDHWAGKQRLAQLRANDKPDPTRDAIQHAISEAYNLGHLHGGNQFRIVRGVSPEKVNEGWEEIANNLFTRIKNP